MGSQLSNVNRSSPNIKNSREQAFEGNRQMNSHDPNQNYPRFDSNLDAGSAGVPPLHGKKKKKKKNGQKKQTLPASVEQQF